MLKNLLSKPALLKQASAAFVNYPVRSFGIRTSQTSVIEKREPLPNMNRDYLKHLNEALSEEALKQIAEAEEERRIVEERFNNKANEKNPANRVSVKIRKPENSIEQVAANLSRPFVLHVQPREPKVLVQGRRRKIPSSLKKMKGFLKPVIGRHIYDAIQILENSHRKAAEYLKKTLIQVRRHAIDKDMDAERLFVSEIVGGKQHRITRIRYHAKGQHGLMNRDTSQLWVKLEERSPEQMYRDFLNGKTPLVLANIMRKELVSSDADLELLYKYNFMLTAKGRQQQRLMLKRRVLTEYYALKQKGVCYSLKMIKEHIVNEEAQKFVEEYSAAKLTKITKSLDKRQEIYKRNEQATA